LKKKGQIVKLPYNRRRFCRKLQLPVPPFSTLAQQSTIASTHGISTNSCLRNGSRIDVQFYFRCCYVHFVKNIRKHKIVWTSCLHFFLLFKMPKYRFWRPINKISTFDNILGEILFFIIRKKTLRFFVIFIRCYRNFFIKKLNCCLILASVFKEHNENASVWKYPILPQVFFILDQNKFAIDFISAFSFSSFGFFSKVFISRNISALHDWRHCLAFKV